MNWPKYINHILDIPNDHVNRINDAAEAEKVINKITVYTVWARAGIWWSTVNEELKVLRKLNKQVKLLAKNLKQVDH